MSEVKYVAQISVPGYLPMADELAVFDTMWEAWSYLADEREHGEDAAPLDADGIESGEYTETLGLLRQLGIMDNWLAVDSENMTAWLESTHVAKDGTGTVYGDTPGYYGEHDLGLAYSVALCTEEFLGEVASLAGFKIQED